jgi:hypothetical protein
VFQKQLCNGIPNVTELRVLRKRLYLKAYNLSIVEHLEQTVFMPLSVTVFVTLATQQHLEYRSFLNALYNALSESTCRLCFGLSTVRDNHV